MNPLGLPDYVSDATQFIESLKRSKPALEAEQRAIETELADGTLYGRDPQRAQGLAERHAAIEAALMEALERWEALDRWAREESPGSR